MAEVLQGKSAVHGIAIGKIHVLDTDLRDYLDHYNAGSPEEEERKYFSAYQAAVQDIEYIIGNAQKKGMREQLEIMEAHKAMIADPVLEAGILEKIRKSVPAPLAVLEASEETSLLLSGLEDPYLRERAADVKDVGRRIARVLLEMLQPDFSENNVIICGETIEPSVIANVSSEKVTGIIIGGGSTTSHAVILASAKGIATVVGIGSQIRRLKDGEEVILDGKRGEIIINADAKLIDKYKRRLSEEKEQLKYYLELSKVPAVTKDGTRVILAANIGNPSDINSAVKFGCEGVGLFRTEFIFSGRDNFPSEEEQFEAYKYVIEKCEGKLCIIRTMDIGGDKPLKYLVIDKEENPFLGWRAIRICLERKDIFITQLKAALRAGVYGKAAIMLPMVINVDEIRKARKLIEDAMEELRAEGKKYAENMPVGIMIETPAAAIMADAMAKECDFFSIGTNDLVQYTLAVDRGNPKVSRLYSHFNPAVLRLIYQIIKAAHSNGIWAGMCGEMAGDPEAAKLLVAMGIDELSMSAPSLPKVKEALINSTIDKEMVSQVLAADDADKIREYLRGDSHGKRPY